MSNESSGERDELELGAETIEDLDVDDADVQGGINITVENRVRTLVAPRPTVPPN